MSEHSAIRQAEQAIFVATNFPIPSRAEHDALAEFLDQAEARLRHVYLGGMQGNAPENWRIGGMQYRDVMNSLDAAKARLTLRLRATQFFMGEKRKEQRAAKQLNKFSGFWQRCKDYEDYLAKMHAGCNTRVWMAGRTKIYQYQERRP